MFSLFGTLDLNFVVVHLSARNMSSVRAVVKVLKHIPRQLRVLYLAQTTP